MKKQKNQNVVTPSNVLSSYDPVKVALAEGNIYGAGASGRFKKSWVTRLGFILLALPFLGYAIFMFPMIYKSLSEAINVKTTEVTLAVGIGGMLLDLSCLWLGLKLIAGALKK